MKPFLSDKCTLASEISLKHEDNVITDSSKKVKNNMKSIWI